jgi:hypothetical protein
MKFKIFWNLFCITVALSMAFEEPSWAQPRRPAGIGSLLELRCYGGGLHSRNTDGIVINRRPYTAVGVFTKDKFSGGISRRTPIEVSCDLAGRNRSPIYKTLTMTVGANEQSKDWNGQYSSRIRLTAYIDGQASGTIEIGFQELRRFSLDVNGARSVAFTVECLESPRRGLCPSLWVLEDKLIQ